MRTVIVPLYGYLNSRFKKLWSITALAKRQRLHFSSQEEIGAYVIALDTIKRKLFYAKTTRGTSSCLIIDLNNLEACSIKKEYNSINAGELKTRKLHHFLKSVFLNLVFKNSTGSVSLLLYDEQKHQQGDLEQLEVQAKRWGSIVSNILPLHITY